MGKIFEKPDDLVSFFFESIIEKGKYKVVTDGNKVIISPRLEQEYYKPNIIINDVKEFSIALDKFTDVIDDFYSKNNNLEHHHDLSFFFNTLLFNMTNTDAQDLTKFIYKRIKMFQNDIFDEYENKKEITTVEGITFSANRVLECPGLETPYCMLFSMKQNDKNFELPLIRYSVDKDTCYIYAVQMGKGRTFNYQDQDYKGTINKVNSGLKKYRDAPPNFILSLALFIKMLDNNHINNIVIPDYLFGRYRKYRKARTENKSDAILERLLDGFIKLLCRLDMQVDGFDILTYPNDFDSYMRIKFKNLNSQNKLLNDILNSDKSL